MPSSPATQRPTDQMNSKQPGQLLYDSEATLRLVDSAMREFGEPEESRKSSVAPVVPASAPTLGLVAFSQQLERGYNELIVVLEDLRQSRALLERSTVESFGHTQFEDIASQQLEQASAVLQDLEQRLAAILRVFNPNASVLAGHQIPPRVLRATSEPNATISNREERPAIAGEIVATRVRGG